MKLTDIEQELLKKVDIGENGALEEHFMKRFNDKGDNLPIVFFFDQDHKHLGTYKEGNDYRFDTDVKAVFKK